MCIYICIRVVRVVVLLVAYTLSTSTFIYPSRGTRRCGNVARGKRGIVYIIVTIVNAIIFYVSVVIVSYIKDTLIILFYYYKRQYGTSLITNAKHA